MLGFMHEKDGRSSLTGLNKIVQIAFLFEHSCFNLFHLNCELVSYQVT